MRGELGNETNRRRTGRRWVRVGLAVTAVGALALTTSACNGPMKAVKRSVAMSCTRYDKAGTKLSTFSSAFVIGITAPTWADRNDAVAVEDATISGAVTNKDWLAIKYKVTNGSPTYLGFFRSPEDDQFDNVVRVKVTGASKKNMEIAVNELFVVHPKGSTYDYDLCKPKAGAVTRLTLTTIR